MAMHTTVATTIIITLLISAPYLRPLREYLFPAESPGGDEKQGDGNHQDRSWNYEQISRSQCQRSNFAGYIDRRERKHHECTL